MNLKDFKKENIFESLNLFSFFPFSIQKEVFAFTFQFLSFTFPFSFPLIFVN